MTALVFIFRLPLHSSLCLFELTGLNVTLPKVFYSDTFNMRATRHPQPSHDSLPSYYAESSAETLPRYTLTDLRPPPKAHTHTRNVGDAAPAPVEEYVEEQPQFSFDEEANIARNNAPTVSIVRFHTIF